MPESPKLVFDRLARCEALPLRRIRFDRPNQVGDRHLFCERDQQMDVVGHAARGDEGTVVISNDSPDVVVEARGEFFVDQPCSVLRAEYEMHVETNERLGHRTVTPSGFVG